jgi:hypothetical protein
VKLHATCLDDPGKLLCLLSMRGPFFAWNITPEIEKSEAVLSERGFEGGLLA